MPPHLSLLPVKQRRSLGQQILADLVHNVLPAEAATAAAALGHRVEDGGDALLHLERAEGDVGVGMQAEDLGRLGGRQRLDGRAEDVDVVAVGHLVGVAGAVVLVDLAAQRQRAGVEVLLRKRVHQQLVEAVGDAAAVLDLADHVAHRLPRRLARLLRVHLHQVVLQELDAGRQVRLVELVRHVPANGAELAPLLGDRVQEAHDEQQLAPLLPRDRVEHVLRDPLVRGAQAGLHADRGLVGDLQK